MLWKPLQLHPTFVPFTLVLDSAFGNQLHILIPGTQQPILLLGIQDPFSSTH